MLTVNQLVGFGAGGKGPPNIQFVGGNTANKAGATSGDTTIALSSGLTGGIAAAVSDGDLVIAVFASGSVADRTLSITDGASEYTLIGSELYSDDTFDTNLRVAYKFVSGDTATTFGPSGNANDGATMAVYVFRGVDASSPLDVTPTTATGVSSSAANPPSITPATAGAYIVCIGAAGHDNFGMTYSSSDLTDFLNTVSADTNRSVLGIGHKPDWTSGPFDAAAFTASASTASDSWAAMSIALNPA